MSLVHFRIKFLINNQNLNGFFFVILFLKSDRIKLNLTQLILSNSLDNKALRLINHIYMIYMDKMHLVQFAENFRWLQRRNNDDG